MVPTMPHMVPTMPHTAPQVALRRAVRIKAEASSSMQLLRAMLPSHVIRKLKAGQTYIAQVRAGLWLSHSHGSMAPPCFSSAAQLLDALC